ncbi:MAG: hypothetical protein ACLQM8_12325, partial [Limisphaerales bacterium]
MKAFEPYDSIKEENPEARAAGRTLVAEGKAAGAEAADVRLRQQPAGGQRNFDYRGPPCSWLTPGHASRPAQAVETGRIIRPLRIAVISRA